MTEAELAAIEARAGAATEGPWRDDGNPEDLRRDQGYQPRWVVIGDVAWEPVESPLPDAEAQQVADAIFIAAARSDVPALVAEVRRLAYRLSEAERWQTTAKEAVRGLSVGSERAIGHPVADAVLVLKRALEKAEREAADLAGLKDVVARLQDANATLSERLGD